MALKTMSLLSAATVSATGGTALAFTDDGVTIPNGVHLVVPADANYATRRSATAKYRPPILTKDGEYDRDKKYISFTIPLVTASGKTVFNVIRVEREVHPELPAATAIEMNKIAAQLLVDADLDNFWGAGSLS